MKASIFFPFCLITASIFAQPNTPVVRPPVNDHPNTTEPNTMLPPAPNSPSPYDPFNKRDKSVNPCSKSLSPYGKSTLPNPGSCQTTGNYSLSPEFTEARAAAMHFINIVDNQVYWGAWLDAGGIMHDIVSQDIWVAGLRSIRSHLGNVRARTFDSVNRLQSMPGGLIGDFVVIRYKTDFAYRSEATEIITLMLHPPIGQWKVISYNVKQ